MHLHNNFINIKNLLQHYKYRSNNIISSFKQVKCCKVYPLENFKNLNKTIFISQPALDCWVYSPQTFGICLKQIKVLTFQ